MNNASMAEVMAAQAKGRKIEKKGEDGYWDSYYGDDFNFAFEYRVKERPSIKLLIAEKFEPIWATLISKKSQEIQAGIMLGVMLGVTLFELIHGAPMYSGEM